MTRSTAPEKKKFTVLSPVGRAVRPVIAALLPKKSAIFQQLFEVWPDLVIGTEAAESIPEKLTFAQGQQKHATLYLWAKTGAQATEMTFNATSFVRKINALFGYEVVRDLRITAFPKIASKESVTKRVSRKSIPSQSLDKVLSGISNPALKSILAGLGGVLGDAPVTHDTTQGDQHA